MFSRPSAGTRFWDWREWRTFTTECLDWGVNEFFPVTLPIALAVWLVGTVVYAARFAYSWWLFLSRRASGIRSE